VLICNFPCTALIDSGSMVTTVSSTFYESYLKQQHPLEKVDMVLSIEGAGGQRVPYLGVTELSFRLPDSDMEDLWIPALVVSDTSFSLRVPMIVGTNVLKVLKEHNVQSADDTWSMAFSGVDLKDPEQDVNIYTCRQVVVPANKSIVITGRVGAARNFTTGVLSPADTLPGGIVIPNTVVERDDKNFVRMQLVNLTGRSIEIPRRQKIADMHQTMVVSDWVEDSTFVQDHSQGTHEMGKEQQPRVPMVDLDDTHLTAEQKQEIHSLNVEWRDVFAVHATELGTAKGVQHKIRLADDDTPFKDRPRRVPPSM